MHILIIEDEAPLANSLAIFLKNQNYAVDIAYNCQKVLESRDLHQYDLIVCDYLLPGMNGQDFVQEIRKREIFLPILMLSAVTDNNNKINLLNKGADDYLTKPFSGEELSARINALLRRKLPEEENYLFFADLSFSLSRSEAIRGGRTIYLTNKEALLLKYLIERPGKICPRRLIIEEVWGEDINLMSNTIEAHILKIRKKIDFKEPKLIHTICGRGYKIDLMA
jgi:DNA-binding response OmpR family regulator